MRRFFIISILILQVGFVKSQTNWKYSDKFSAKCMGGLKSSQGPDVIISIQNDSIIIADSFKHQCCPKFALRISDIQNDSIYVEFQDTTKAFCNCICDFHTKLNIGQFVSDKLKINYNDTWYSISLPDFAPIGANWYYNERFAFSGDIDFMKITSVIDTTINEKPCRLIRKDGNPMCSGRPDEEYLYEESNRLYFWDPAFNKFQVLYDLNKAIRDYWIIEVKDIMRDNNSDTIKIVVDSISSLIINDKTLKVLHVTYQVLTEVHPYSYQSKIIEKIGDIQYLFNFYPNSSLACDGNYADGLRCYNDSYLGNYSTGIVDSCNYTYKWTGIDEIGKNPGFSVYPNPTTGLIEINSIINDELTAILVDITGRPVNYQSFYQNTRIDLTNYQNGSYFLMIKQKDKRAGIIKIIKN